MSRRAASGPAAEGGRRFLICRVGPSAAAPTGADSGLRPFEIFIGYRNIHVPASLEVVQVFFNSVVVQTPLC